jgi:dTDP-4-amino-4,6-dideoxygalactose transaminase
MCIIRNYGQRIRYYHDVKGINSRLDDIQAAILITKLSHLDEWNSRRRDIANRYLEGIQNPYITKMQERSYGQSNFHLFIVRTSSRDRFQAHLASFGISTVIHYPVPVHLQRAYADLGYQRGDFPVAERLASEVLSLPIFPELTEREVDAVIQAVNDFKG